jgi:hypothetical protein
LAGFALFDQFFQLIRSFAAAEIEDWRSAKLRVLAG